MKLLSPTSIATQITTPTITRLLPGLRFAFVRRDGLVRLTISRAAPTAPSLMDCEAVARLFAIPVGTTWRSYRLVQRQQVGTHTMVRRYNAAEVIWYEVVQ